MKVKPAVLIGAIVVLMVGTIPPALPRTILIDRIIARVNEEIITQRQYDEQKEKLRGQIAREAQEQEASHQLGDPKTDPFQNPKVEAVYQREKKNLLRDMIDQDLLVQKAKDVGISVDVQVVERLDQIRKQLGLASIQDLQKEVEKQGLIWEDFENNIRRGLLTQQVIEQQVGSRIMVTRAEARKYFNAHKQEFASPAGDELAEIQISKDKWGAVKASQRADAAFKKLQAGAKWAEIVKQYSDGPNAKSGGDVGFFPTGSLQPVIANSLKGLDPGDWSKVIPTQYGYIIVKVINQRSPGAPKFNEVQQQVDNILYEQKMAPALRAYLTRLRKQSYIFLAPGFVDTGAVHPGEPGSAQEAEQ